MSRKRQFEPSWYPGAGMDSVNRISFTDMGGPKSTYDHSERSSVNVGQFLAKTSSLFQELEEEVRKVLKVRRIKDKKERIESKRIAEKCPLADQDFVCSDVQTCSEMISKVSLQNTSQPCDVADFFLSCQSPVSSGIIAAAPKSLLRSACDFCVNMDSKTAFSVKAVAALALVGSAASYMPSLSLDVSRRAFVRSTSHGVFLSSMPSSVIEKAKTRAVDGMLFSIQGSCDAAPGEGKLLGHEGLDLGSHAVDA